MEKSLLVEKSKAEESPWENIRKKIQALRRKKGCNSVKKRKKSLCESDWYWRSPRWCPDFEQRSHYAHKVTVKPKFAIHGSHYCVVLLNLLPSDRD